MIWPLGSIVTPPSPPAGCSARGKGRVDSLAQLGDSLPRVTRGTGIVNVMGTLRRTGTGLPSTRVTSYSHWRAATSAASSNGGTLRVTSTDGHLARGVDDELQDHDAAQARAWASAGYCG